jgi:HEAT repeat protein
MADNAAPGGGTVGALMEAMDLLESLPPAGPALRERGYTSEAHLLEGLSDPDAEVRRGCLELLDDAWSADAAPRVVERLDDPEWIVRYNAVHAFVRGSSADRRSPGPLVLPAVIRTAGTDESKYVRMLAVELVGDAARTEPSAADALVAVRDTDVDPTLRRKAARCAPGGATHAAES